jgi:hypothetical protein
MSKDTRQRKRALAGLRAISGQDEWIAQGVGGITPRGPR